MGTADNGSRSARLAARFGVSLPEDVAGWWDANVWDEEYAIEFGVPVSPEELLRDKDPAVWGGQMLPDTLPILGDGGGDAVCLRFDGNGRVRELVRWQHEGAFWSSCGDRFSEMLIFEIIRARSGPERLDPDEIDLLDGIAGGALRRLDGGAELREAVDKLLDNPKSDAVARLVELGIAETPCREALCDAFCARSKRLWRKFGNDWRRAAEQAQQVAADRDDLAWPFAVTGRAAERAGDTAAAAAHYHRGLLAFGTAMGFAATWEEGDRFFISRLRELEDELPDALRQDVYFSTVMRAGEGGDSVDAARSYWLDRARSAESEQRYADAYDAYYRAGWDVYVRDDIEQILEKLAACAEAAGWESLARIARHHLANTA